MKQLNNWSVRYLSLQYGENFDGHEHWIDHLTVCITGPVQVDWRDPDGTTGSRVLDKGDELLIPAPRFHKFTALHPRGASWRCIYNYAEAELAGVSRANFDKDK